MGRIPERTISLVNWGNAPERFTRAMLLSGMLFYGRIQKNFEDYCLFYTGLAVEQPHEREYIPKQTFQGRS